MSAGFWILAAMTVLGAVLAVTLRNLVHCVLSVVLFFFGIAGLFFLLRAEFLGAVQILIYVGAVGILFLFAIMLTHRVFGARGVYQVAESWWARVLAAAAVFAGLGIAIGNQIFGGQAAGPQANSETWNVTTRTLGEAIMSPFLLPFEVVSVLLTAGMIGAIVIAMDEKRRDREEE
jgi:NADH-quinone oxidoreductase subunit J